RNSGSENGPRMLASIRSNAVLASPRSDVSMRKSPNWARVERLLHDCAFLAIEVNLNPVLRTTPFTACHSAGEDPNVSRMISRSDKCKVSSCGVFDEI